MVTVDGAVTVLTVVPIATLSHNAGVVDPMTAVPLSDGRVLLATFMNDGTTRVWDPLTGDTISTLPGTHHAGATAVLPLPDGRVLLATTSGDGTARVWEVVLEDRVPRVPRVPGYISDAAAGTDLLDRDREAVAIADLLTARSARPPLAVGVFGQWGEGKSQFLELVHAAVAARSAAASASGRTSGRADPIAHAQVRQVRFNAWHYAEADVWASLVAELFAQLGSGQDPGEQARQRSRLTSEVIRARGLREQLAGARDRLVRRRTPGRGLDGLATWRWWYGRCLAGRYCFRS